VNEDSSLVGMSKWTPACRVLCGVAQLAALISLNNSLLVAVNYSCIMEDSCLVRSVHISYDCSKQV